MAGIALSSNTSRTDAHATPIKRTARRGATCLMLTLTKCGFEVDEDSFHVSSLSFFSTPVLMMDCKLEGQQVRISSKRQFVISV
jgi:hypothetical protein